MAHGIKIVSGERNDQWRVIRDETMLCGLITEIENGPRIGRYRVELFMRIDETLGTREEAMAFARGAISATQAFGIYKRASEGGKE